MQRFYFVPRIQTWISVKDIVTILREGDMWTVVLSGNLRFRLTDAEYADLENTLKDIEDEWKGKREEREHRRKQREAQ